MTVLLQPARFGFDPNTVSGLSKWFKADALALNDGDAVGTWTLSGGEAGAATQATASLKPTFKTGILNSLPVVRFDGVDDYMGCANFAVALSQPTTIFVVANSTNASGANGNFVDGTLAAGTSRHLIGATSSSDWRMYSGTVLTEATTRDSSFYIFAGIFNGASSKLYRGGGAAKASGNAGTNTLTGLRLGGDMNGATQLLAGDEAEILVYNAGLSLGDLDLVGNYLAAKYALTWAAAS